MIEKIGDCVSINGGFVVVDHTDKKEDNKGIASVINVYSVDEKKREKEIHTVVRIFASGGGSKLKAGNTNFSISNIFTNNPSNDKPLENHKGLRKMVVIKNETTDEFFLIMDKNQSLKEASEFLDKISRDKNPLLKDGDFYKELQFPRPHGLGKLRVDGDPTFEVVMGMWLVAIKLEVD